MGSVHGWFNFLACSSVVKINQHVKLLCRISYQTCVVSALSAIQWQSDLYSIFLRSMIWLCTPQPLKKAFFHYSGIKHLIWMNLVACAFAYLALAWRSVRFGAWVVHLGGVPHPDLVGEPALTWPRPDRAHLELRVHLGNRLQFHQPQRSQTVELMLMTDRQTEN